MATVSVDWHGGGKGNCYWCGKLSDDRAAVGRDDRLTKLPLCERCAEKVDQDRDRGVARAMNALETAP